MKYRIALPIVVLALVILSFLRGGAKPTPGSGSPAPQPGTAQHVASNVATASESRTRTAVVPLPPTVLVTDPGGTPIAEAELSTYVQSDVGTLNLDSQGLARSGSDGKLVHKSLSNSGERFLVSHRDFVPAVVAGGIEGEVVLVLSKAPRLTVSVVTDLGIPLPEATLVMSPRVDNPLAVLPVPSDGDPLHPRPVWTRRTDITGSAQFQAAPTGLYFVGVVHDHYAPLLFEPKFVRLESDTNVSFTMQDMYGVVFALPEPGAINKLEWNWNRSGTDRSFGVVSRNAECRKRLEARFPDSHAFVGRPSPSLLARGETLDVGLRIVLENGTAWIGRWPLSPIRSIKDPVYLEQDLDTQYRHVKVELRTASGRLLDIPLRIARADIDYSQGNGPYVDAVPAGQPQFLAHGPYFVEPTNAAAWLIKECNDLKFTVSEIEPATDVVRLTINKEFVPITIVPKFATATLLSRLHMVIDDVEKEGISIANWEPSRGPVQLLAPAGKLTIITRSQCYEDLDLEVDVTADPPMEPILVQLTERPAPTLGK